jgi:ribonuclease HI
VSARREHHCYTDGACKAAHEGAGGWGFFIRPPEGAPLEGYGKAWNTLAKTMEYQAVAEALAALPHGAHATVYSDNQSLVESLTRQLESWRSNGFAKVDPLIVESVRRIAGAVADKQLVVRWHWVRGHAGNAGNERADQLAAQGAREAKAELAQRRRPKPQAK